MEDTMQVSTIPAPLTMDIVKGKCHVFENMSHKSIYCSDNAFEALNYIANEDKLFDISDIASAWIDIEAYESFMSGMKQNPQLFGLCA